MPDHTIHVVNHFGRKQKYAIIPGPPMMTFPDTQRNSRPDRRGTHQPRINCTDPSQGVGTTAQKPNFGVKVTSVDVRDADPGTPTTPASTFGLTKNEKGNPVMTEKEKTAPMDMVRFDFSGDLSPSNDNTSCLEWPRGTDCLIIVWFPAPSDTNAVKFVIMAPVIQLWVCAYDAEEEHKQDGTFEITYS
ncbi:hypothetical protein AnigIFM63604_008088 [Aspergillus niger]|uniref:Uncharacterized protein n=1 Tax=Aspergillus niger TaxID=5061 RepID=A0A9W6ECK4_ASPNG|nr:hypothetical protein AnigIFM63604_008088 [Aspergillus niger]